MGIETVTLMQVLSAASAASSVIGGIQQSRAASRQAANAQAQAVDQARAETRSNLELEKKQKLAFLKSGVALEGSPFLVMAEDAQTGEQNVGAILRSGANQARSIRRSGRQALFSGFASGADTIFSGYQEGIFGGSTAPKPGRNPRYG